jgi:uncharacterized protein
MRLSAGRLLLSPSDLNDYVECRHCATLSLEVALGKRARPKVSDQAADLLRQKGEAHEREYLRRLHEQGLAVVEITSDNYWDFDAAAAQTIEAMRSGADAIWQATFVDGSWRGRADFLLKIPGSSALGSWCYEPLDAKLARAEKPTYVLQLCFYADGVATVQGSRPERMHVLLGPGEQLALRYDDLSAYYRRVRARFESVIAAPLATEPYPVEHCSLCSFRGVCEERWDAEDHLVRVANTRRGHVTCLRSAGVATLKDLACLPPGTPVPAMSPHAIETLRDQASLQLERRTTGRLPWHPIECGAGRGFDLLPKSSPQDIIFDIEGDPFWEPARGLHFLFGLLLREDDRWRYQPMWAHKRSDERRMFESFIDLVHARLANAPGMHVYHYGTYENAAIKELMGIYATREDAVDELLKRGVLVNLHMVVRQALRAGVPSYSLKETEALAAFQRQASVHSGMQAVLTYEKWMGAHDDALLGSIAAYNEEDCRATLALRDWLIDKHPADRAWLDLVDRKDGNNAEQRQQRATLREQLIDGAEPHSPRWLAGELLEYHRREARPGWWWFYQRQDHMTEQELFDDAEALARMEPTGEVSQEKKSRVHTLRFPAQQHKLSRGDAVCDPATKGNAGTIEAIDDTTCTLRLRRGPGLVEVALPRAIIPKGPYATDAQQSALLRLATSMLADDGRYAALRDILARTPPRIGGTAARSAIQTIDLDRLRELTAALDDSYLFIQGPPGTGKTYTGARLIAELMRRGRRVGVTSTSHKAIHNLLDEVEKVAAGEGIAFRGFKKGGGDNDESRYESASIVTVSETKAFAGAAPDVLLFAGTAWLFAHELLDGTVDTLFIDEAGQVSLADALAMGTSARNVILLGDPLQLAQVSQGTHPAGSEKSVLEHLLGDRITVPADMGIFLEQTRRMHPDVCRFISEIVYDSRLVGVPELARQSTAFGTGLRFLAVEHAGNAAASSEEANAVAAEIARMIDKSWTDRDGRSRPLVQQSFMVVAPYNAQVRRLREALRSLQLGDVAVGTVDKFQGRQAPVVFYSMATSSIEDVPRSLEFLFSRNRLNVAISRAMCLACIVASPRLLESHARTVDQMRLINALCRFVEMAEKQAAERGAV